MIQMDPRYLIRPLTPSDPAVIEAAFAGIGWTKPAEKYEHYLAEQEADRRRVFVAEAGGDFAGYVTLNWHPAYPPFRKGGLPEIQDLNVLPRFRRRGLGTALLRAAENAARERSDRVGIGVGLVPDYGAAQRLYVRLGYLPDGRGIAYAGRTVEYQDRIVADDDLVLYFTKRLAP
jgi:GNAT superfamily N-acetyltransferase